MYLPSVQFLISGLCKVRNVYMTLTKEFQMYFYLFVYVCVCVFVCVRARMFKNTYIETSDFTHSQEVRRNSINLVKSSRST